MRKSIITLSIVCIWAGALAQGPFQKESRSFASKAAKVPILIDGELNDAAWKDAAVVGDFYQNFP